MCVCVFGPVSDEIHVTQTWGMKQGPLGPQSVFGLFGVLSPGSTFWGPQVAELV